MGGLGAFVVRANPREYRRSKISESVDGQSELFMPAVNTECRRSVIIAQREPGSDLEVFPTAGGDSGNPREFWEKRSGESGKIHPVSWQCRPHTVSGSRTERTGDHELERVPDLRFCVVRDDSAVKVSRLRELVDNSPSYLGASELQRMSGR